MINRQAIFTGRQQLAIAGQRGGTVYLAVLCTSVLVAMLSLTAMQSARMSLHSVNGLSNDTRARTAAMAAIENAISVINADDNWRTSLTSSQVYPDSAVLVGGTKISWAVIDPDDGDLSNDAVGRAIVHGTGEIEDSVYTYQVELLQRGGPLTCLEAALHCNSNISAFATVDLYTDTFISSNQSTSTMGNASFHGNVQAVGSASGSGSGLRQSGVAPRHMPGPAVFDYYRAMGTEIDPALLQSNGKLVIDDVLISTHSNPYGAVNPEGIYWIDCGGVSLEIKRSRLACTLVLFDTGTGASVESSVHIEPPQKNMPALLVDGNLIVRQDLSAELVENSSNFNPAHTPMMGMSDTDTTDRFPSLIRGLVYVSGQLNLALGLETSFFEGCVVCESIAATSKAHFNYTPYAFNSPPPGFCLGDEVQIMPGSWRRVAASQAVSGSGGSGTTSS